MRNRGGLCPRVRVDAVGSGIVSQAGGVLLVDTARATGLDRALSVALARWRKRLAVHDPGKVVWDLAVTLALGRLPGRCRGCCAPSRGCTGGSPPTPRCPG